MQTLHAPLRRTTGCHREKKTGRCWPPPGQLPSLGELWPWHQGRGAGRPRWPSSAGAPCPRPSPGAAVLPPAARLPLPVLSHPDWSSSRVVFVLCRRRTLGRVASSRFLVCAVSVGFLFGVPGTQTTRWRFTGTDGIVALGQDREAEGPEHQVQLRTQGIPPIPGAAGGHGPAGTA